MHVPSGYASGAGIGSVRTLMKVMGVEPPTPLPPNPYWESKIGDMLKWVLCSGVSWVQSQYGWAPL